MKLGFSIANDLTSTVHRETQCVERACRPGSEGKTSACSMALAKPVMLGKISERARRPKTRMPRTLTLRTSLAPECRCVRQISSLEFDGD